jgi:hypothetical protein
MDDLSRGATWVMSFLIHPNAADEDEDEEPAGVRVPPLAASRPQPARPDAPSNRIAAE